MTEIRCFGRPTRTSLLVLLLTLSTGCTQIPLEQTSAGEPPPFLPQSPSAAVIAPANFSTHAGLMRPAHLPQRLADSQPERTTIRLSPRVRTTALNQSIALSRDALEPFLKHSIIVTQATWDAAPILIGTDEDRLLFSAGDRVYARGIKFDQHLYQVFHRGKEYRDPVTGDSLGFEGGYVGEAILEKEGDPATLRLITTSQDVRSGDRLFPVADEDGIYQFIPHAPPAGTEGRIIATMGDASLIGQYQTVVLNLGEQNGMEPGHVLTIFKADRNADNLKKDAKVSLPDEQAGQIMIYKVYDRTSYGLVTDASRTIHLLDRVVSPES